MKKIKKIILTLLVLSFLANPMYLILRVHAANEEIAMSRISDTLQSVMQSSEEETIEVMIWLEDIDTSATVLSSTKDLISGASEVVLHRGLCEVSKTDTRVNSQISSASKEAKRECYEEYTQSFAESVLYEEEIVYLSKYAPIVIARLTSERISQLSNRATVESLEYYCDDVEEQSSEINADSISNRSETDVYYSMSDIKQYLNINDLITYVGLHADEETINIGVLDEGLPDNDCIDVIGFNNIEIHHYGESANNYSHPAFVLEILHSIVPQANYYYATYLHLGNSTNYTLIGEIDWLLQKNVNVINCSLLLECYDGQGNGDGFSTYGAISEYLDYISSDYSVTIVKSAGNPRRTNENSPYTYYGISSGGMGYNVITVGNYNLSNHTLDIISEYYQGDILTNKPDVCAPGQIQFTTYGGAFRDNGTSYSAPIVAGLAALIILYYDSIIFPCEVKSIICAGCSDHRYSSDNDLFEKYGAGVVDGWYIKQILSGNQQISNSFEPNELTHTYTFRFNEDYPVMDFVLVFDKMYYEDIGFDIGNLDLYLYDSDGNYIDSSTSTKNNLEVLVEITQETECIILEVRQTQALDTEWSDITEDICVFYSLSWRFYD